MKEGYHTLFGKILSQKGIHKVTGKKSNAVRQLRYRNKKNANISLETKFFYLRKAGIRLEDIQWTDKDMIAFAKFCMNASAIAREFGAEYILEKFKINRNQL